MPLDRAMVERYVGLRYQPGVFDCADLVMRVQAELFGRHLVLPQDRNRPASLLAQRHEISRWLPHLVRRRAPGEAEQDGDGVLLAVGAVPCHLGVLLNLDEPWVLHADNALQGSVLTRRRELAVRGYHLEGVYAWRI
jgi:hypothetical protein